MKILVDIIHPANVHYFKNFIIVMSKEGHDIIVSSRNKDVSFDLLKAYNINYFDFGKGSIGGGAIGKILYLIIATFKFIRLFIMNKPNISISFGSSALAIVSWIFRTPHISFDDTEHAKLNRMLYVPFTPLVISPSSFYENLGNSHFKFNGYMELFYLHKNKFKPNKSILSSLGLLEGEVFTIFRFVSWGAFHDIGQKGLNTEERIALVNEALKFGKVFISSEGDLPIQLKKYEMKIAPEKLHDVLYYAKLYIGEGGTTASECAMLGTPSIYINSLPLMGYLKDACKHHLLYHLHELEDIKVKIDFIFNQTNTFYQLQRDLLLKNTIDPTLLLVWIVNNYPNSKKILLQNSEYQNKFK